MNILIIVESNFLKIHIGVLRVILNYYRKLVDLGHIVDFATPQLGKLYLGLIHKSPALSDSKVFEQGPCWTSETAKFIDLPEVSQETIIVNWTEQIADPNNYDVNLISTPWLCALGLPFLPNAIGIVYDMVPNLIACEILKMPVPMDIYKFASDHDVGYSYYLANAKKIACISNSTKLDFLRLYKTAQNHPSIITHIPFSCNPKNLLSNNLNNKSIILVNILDWRKNLFNIEKVLVNAATKQHLKVYIIGKERIPIFDAISFMERISSFGIKVEWYRSANCETLRLKYLESSVLLFPSLYEGLGLPVMEAQSLGIPAITSNISSLPEININKNLCFDPDDISGMASSICQILKNPSQIKTGMDLQEEFEQYIEDNQQLENLINIH